MWKYRGQERPDFAAEPGPGQESVWDYPRPPTLDPDVRQIVIMAAGERIAECHAAIRVLETAGPPTFYLPPSAIDSGYLEAADGTSLCEWKGQARYWDVVVPGQRIAAAAWSYPDPTPGYRLIADFLAFYPARVDCFVDGERVRPQPGGLYGGWLTDDIAGPVKGEPGTAHW